uniref:Uncharacterized protein n=1 Tax=Siphoviridae sp. ctr2f5 TaxID=2825684 RepID=A0A8S5QF35_9CAUD|nr:MAG TPA: hypothetical protein [Siphoviridae sp. ctr2f5]
MTNLNRKNILEFLFKNFMETQEKMLVLVQKLLEHEKAIFKDVLTT